jgi:hypothetical protein
VGATAPSAELGFDQAGLDRLVRDAAARAEALLAGADLDVSAFAAAGLDLDEVTDAIRRCSSGSLDSASVARVTGCDPAVVPSLTAAWDAAGVVGVDVLLHPRRLTDVEVAEVEAAWETTVKTRSTGALLPDGRYVRRAADATWVVVAPDEIVGWRVAEVAAVLDDLTTA